MEYFLEALAAALIVIVGPLLTLVGLPGNTLMLLAGVGFACFDGFMFLVNYGSL